MPRAFGSLVARNRRRYGGYVVHAAIVLLAIGIAGSSAYDTSQSARLAPGQSCKLRDYTLVYRGTTTRRASNAIETRANIDVFRGGDRIAVMHPGKNNYPVEQQVSNEVAIRSDWLTGEDLFLITEQVNANGTIDFKAIVNPLVNLIWLAGFVFLLGSVITLWPDAREERRLAIRYGRARPRQLGAHRRARARCAAGRARGLVRGAPVPRARGEDRARVRAAARAPRAGGGA